MGLDASASTVVGVIISEEDFCDTTTETKIPYKCDKCKENHQAGNKFCSECGNKFKAKKITTTTLKPHILSCVAKDQNISEEEAVEDFETCGFSSEFFSDFCYRTTNREGEELLIFGEELNGTGSHRSSRFQGIVCASIKDFEITKEKVEIKLRSMGVEKPVQIFTILDMSW